MAQPSSPSIGRGIVSLYRDVFASENLAASLHLLLNFVIGTFSFVVVVTLLATTVGLLLVFPIAFVTGWLLWAITTGLGILERGRFRILLDSPITTPPAPSADGVLEGARQWLTSGATWRSIFYMLLLLPLGILTFTVTLVVWMTPIGLIVGAFDAAIAVGVSWPLLVLSGLLGVGLVAFIPFPIRAMAELNRAIGWGLLGPSQTDVLEEKVSRLDQSRTRMAESAEDERKRIERDLHDGAQQRLVSLAMSLGMAKEKLDTDMEGAKELVEEAHVQTKRALTELRDLARGIHPALLSEKGLKAALTPLAAVSPVPVSLSVRVEERPAEAVESVAYFVVSEALANMSKHSDATRATVTIEREDDRLVVEVRDDGVGGADPDGRGLAGLRNRVEAIDGWFSVTSPDGGPTTIMAELPCS